MESEDRGDEMEQEEEVEQEYVDLDEVEEVLQDEEEEEQLPDEVVEESYEEHDVINLENNSVSYFDKHIDSVYMIATHPTVPLALSGGGDDIAYVWTTKLIPPKLVTTLTGHKESVITGGFTSDGEYIVTGDMAGNVRIWKSHKQFQQWEYIDSIEDEVDEVVWIAFHPKEPVFAFGASDGSVWVYALNGRKVEQLSSLYGGHNDRSCLCGAFVPTTSGSEEEQGTWTLITVGEDSSIVAWRVPTGEQLFKLPDKTLRLNCAWVSLSIQPSGQIAAVGSDDGKFCIISIRNGTILTVIDTVDRTTAPDLSSPNDENEKSIEGLAWSESHGILAVGSVSGDIRFYDTSSWRLRRSISESREAITKLEFLQGGKSPYVIASSIDSHLYKIDCRNGQVIWKGSGHSEGILGFALCKRKEEDTTQRIVTAGDDGVCLLFDC